MGNRLKTWFAEKIGRENLEFLTHTRNYLSATVLQSILVALAIPILTQLLLPDEYGVLSVFASLYALLSILFSLNLRSGVVRYYLEKSDDFDRALGTNLLFVGLFGMALLAFMLPLSSQLAQWVGVETAVFQLAMATAVFSGILEIYLSYLRGSKQSKKYSILVVLRTGSILGAAIVLILFLDEKKYLGKIYAELILTGVFAVYAVIAMIRLARFSFDSKYIKYTCRFSIPLIPHAVSRYILGYFDRIIIQQLTTSAATGLYSLAYDVAMSMDVIVMATVKAWQPIFFDEYRKGNFEKINRMAYAYSGYIYFAAVIIILFGADAARLIVPETYFGGLHLIPILVIGYVFVFLYTLFFQYASYAKKTELISLSTLLAAGANIILNYRFIPIYGYEAAAYTTTASFALLFILHYSNARFILRAKVLKVSLLLPNFCLLAALAAGYIYSDRLELNAMTFLAARIALSIGAFYYFIVKIARGTKKS